MRESDGVTFKQVGMIQSCLINTYLCSMRTSLTYCLSFLMLLNKLV